MPRGKKELAEQITPYAARGRSGGGGDKTVTEAVKKIGATKRLTRCSRQTVLIERWWQHYNTIRTHSAERVNDFETSAERI